MIEKIKNALTSVMSFINAIIAIKIAGKNNKELVNLRADICLRCQKVDTKGQRFFRFHHHKPVCGVPFQLKPIRTPETEGCGCKLDLKWAMPDQACPVGYWRAVEEPQKQNKKPRRKAG